MELFTTAQDKCSLLNEEEQRGLSRVKKPRREARYHPRKQFQDNIAQGVDEWRCRAGARYLYICEDGLVHYCSQQRGYPGIPLENYTAADIRREFLYRKILRPALHRIVRAWYPWSMHGAPRRVPR